MTSPIWMAFPPEVFSTLLSAGPGAGQLLAASASWEALSEAYTEIAEELSEVLASVQAGAWQGPSAESYVAAHIPFLSWLLTASADAKTASGAQAAAATAHTTAVAAMPTMAELTANHITHGVLLATNFLGINLIPIAINEAEYIAMWIRAALTMGTYEGAGSAAVQAASAAANTPASPQVLQHVHHHTTEIPPSNTEDAGEIFKGEWWSSRFNQFLTALQNDLASPNPIQSLLTDGFMNSVLPHYAGEVIVGLTPSLTASSPTLAGLLPIPAVAASGAGLAGLSGLSGLAGINDTTPISGFVPDTPPANVTPGVAGAGATGGPAPAITSGAGGLPPTTIQAPSSVLAGLNPPTPPPVFGAEGTSLAYLVAGSHARSSSSAHSHGTTRTGREAAEEAGAGVGTEETTAGRRRRRRAGLTDPGNRYEYLDADATVAASARGAGPMGFTGTTRAVSAAGATGLATLTAPADDAAATGPKLPMMPGTWAIEDFEGHQPD